MPDQVAQQGHGLDGTPPVSAALRALFEPLATLAMSHGLPYAQAEEALKQAFVNMARRPLLEGGLPEHRLVSRISAATGINRREVSRLTQPAQGEPDQRASRGSSLLAEVFTRWMTDPALRGADGKPMPLPRTGAQPSFDALCRSITQDIHPRGVLEQLCRLGVVEHALQDDTVHPRRTSFVPQGDQRQMLAFFVNNVGDHLKGAVHNLTDTNGLKHLDQAVYASGLSEASLDTIRQFVTAQWQRLLGEAVPLLEQCIERDRQPSVGPRRRVRIGLYGYDDSMPADEPGASHNKQEKL